MVVYIVLIVIVSSAGIFFILTRRPLKTYNKDLRQERKGKDGFMKDSAQSPFAQEKEKFTGLNYFDPNLKYKVTAKLVKIPDGKLVSLSTSTGEEEIFFKYAFAEFELEGVKNRLLIFEPEDRSQASLFVTFKDKTSAKETYGAGRYLEVSKIDGATSIELDFNKAFNPYCAYNDSFSCPFPPKENYLNVAVEAGEKKYHL